MWEVPGSPADHREAESHCLAPDRPVRLTRSREHEDVGCLVEGCNVLSGQWPVHDDTAGEVGLRKARPYARRVTGLGRFVTGEMERPRIGRKARECVQKLEDPFPRQPVCNREERRSAPPAKVLGRTLWRSRHVSPRRDDPNLRPGEPRFDELLSEMVTRCDQKVRLSQGEPIEGRLRPLANGAMVDAAGWLMEDGDHRDAGTSRREGRAGKRSGDRVEEDCVRPELPRRTKHCCAAKSSEREGPFGKGKERDARGVRRRRLRHTQVVQVTPA